MQGVLNYINDKIDTRLVIFTLLALVFARFGPNENEEHYFQLAMQYTNPDWVLDSWVLTEFPGTRLIYQWIVGFLLQILSFEQVAFFGKLVLCLLYSFPLAKLYKALHFSNMDVLFHLFLLCFFSPFFIAGEWILLGFETKHFAYLFVFYSFYYFFQESYLKSVFFGIIATYFHILVGGWFMAYLLLYHLLFSPISFKNKILHGLIYAVLISPFFLYIAKTALVQPVGLETSIHPDWIYSYFRHPHHCGLFVSEAYFLRSHVPGLIKTLLALGISLLFYYEFKHPLIKKINQFNLLTLIGVLFFVLVAYFDKQGSFVKFYPFRINALSYFMTGILSIYMLRTFCAGVYQNQLLNSLILVIALIWWSRVTWLNSVHHYEHFMGEETTFELATGFIQQTTPERSVILYLDQNEDGMHNFIRKARRDRFVSYKFVPGGTTKLIEWYNRVLERRAIREDLSHLLESKKKYRIDYLLIHQPVQKDFLQLLYQNEGYFLYRIL